MVKLPTELYAIYKPLKEELDALEVCHNDTLFITVDTTGRIEEHADNVFMENGFWFSEGDSYEMGFLKAVPPPLPAEVSVHLIRHLPPKQDYLF